MITAHYYDGETSRRHPVQLLFHRGLLALDGDGVRRSVRLSKVRVSEPLEHAPRILMLPDGTRIECEDPGLPRLLRKNGYREPRIVRWQRNWPLSLLSLLTLLAVLIAGYQWGLPAAADAIARQLPAELARRIGDEQLALMDEGFMEPSRLSPQRQAALRERFAAMRKPAGSPAYRIEFRHSKVGPNAFALPNGVIVMTDQLVAAAPADEAVLGVLAHELGHLQQRHSLRGLLQTIGVGVVINLLVGDVSTALAAAPTFLLDQAYSRDFEREADSYAIGVMQANRLPMSPMADLFERMADAGHDDDSRGTRDAEEEEAMEYLSSHPADAERIERFRRADQSMTGLSAN
ncbi:M48 family metallopeptidase [Noviherbaspirillum aridicola]|uniref:Peptidase M48 n=1 Tax=Noviherbaspirillum aridicola TaxID=2849687 RepID=A0ABQ4Q481_9BURK|nr:M48 family metallopeptidase [Noviherbaspirillum aridicola]GIZ51959.1 peptidase M48 [Noviherbaspirillum aridicola]